MRAGAVAASFALLGFAAPAALHRMETQEANAQWREKAETFVEAFALEAPREAEPMLAGAADQRLWRLARAYGSLADLDAADRDNDAIGVYQTFAAAHFDQAQRQAQELRCLAQTIYYEARSESRQGQLAVAEVVLNRVRHRLYPDTICSVVFEGVEEGRRSGCQFTFACDGSMRREPRGRAWANAERMAAHVMLGLETGSGGVGSATHYHTVAVSPNWSQTLVRMAQVGSHIFYRFPGRSERVLQAPVTPVSAPASDLPQSAITSDTPA